MEEQNSIHSFTNFINTSEYSGERDQYYLRTGIGDEKWIRNDHQRYSGWFLHDSLHGRGRYLWSRNGENTLYDGLFHSNVLEGYGKFSYHDCSTFEGLFKNNRRFGPGVYTYLDGSQDVGMWLGQDLIRLCRTVKSEWVPRLANTSLAKIILLKYRRLVQVCNKMPDRAKNILLALGANERVLNEYSKLYNVHIRNPASHFFDSNLFDDKYFCENDCYIEVALSPEEEASCKSERGRRNYEEFEAQQAENEKSERSSFVSESSDICVCQNPTQVRNEWLKSEIEHIDEILAKLNLEIKHTQRIEKRLKKRHAKYTIIPDSRKSITWELMNRTISKISPKASLLDLHFQEKNGSDPLGLQKFEEELNFPKIEEGEEMEEDEEEEELEEFDPEEELDYDEVCRQLEAALDLRTNLSNKKNRLTEKIVSEPINEIKTEEEAEITQKPPTKLVLISDLLAWNNGKRSIEILKHVFLHRNFENDMTFSIERVVCGDRSEFHRTGSYEDDCIAFLKECSNGNIREAHDLLRKRDLHPDLCDSRGNTGIIYAAARDRIKIIRMLVNSGATLDVYNDECLTPLSICLTRYLALKFQVTDWEKAFLRTTSINPEEEKEVRVWRPHASITSLTTVSQSKVDVSMENLPLSSQREKKSFLLSSEAFSEVFKSSLDVIRNIGSTCEVHEKIRRVKISTQEFQDAAWVSKDGNLQSQTYIFDTEPIIPPPPPKVKEKKKGKQKKEKTKKSKKKKGSKQSSKSSKASSKKSKKSPKEPPAEPETPQVEPEDSPLNNQLDAIHNTIITLLNYGADPNLAEVPLPLLTMAVFTKNACIVRDLLKSKADPNVVTLDEHLTALHVLVSLPPTWESLEILRILLQYSANPNIKTNQNHWIVEKAKLLGNRALLGEDDGKSTLHLLCMRYDFLMDADGYLTQMVPILMEHGGKVKERYLGHTPLSLAVLRGNLKLIRTLLDSKKINPNQLLGEDMGIPLTILILKRYEDALPEDKCKEVMDVLVEYKGNPLNDTEVWGNCIDFMVKEHQPPPKATTKKKKQKKTGSSKGSKRTTKSKDSKSSKSSKRKHKGKKTKPTQDEIKRHLLEQARLILQKHIKGWAVSYLYSFVQDENYYDDMLENMVKFLTPQETIQIAQLLFHRGKIPVEPKNYETLYDLVEFVININSKIKGGSSTISKEINIDEMLKDFEFKVIPKEQGKLNLPEPEVEKHSEKYNVCFNCCRKKDLQLFICPNCRLVYFCSQECNIKNNVSKDVLHNCGSLFYRTQKEIYEEQLKSGGNIDVMTFGRGKLSVQPDESKRLHLTRNLKKAGLKTLREAKKRTESYREGRLSLKWKKTGFESSKGWKIDAEKMQGKRDRKEKGTSRDVMLNRTRKLRKGGSTSEGTKRSTSRGDSGRRRGDGDKFRSPVHGDEEERSRERDGHSKKPIKSSKKRGGRKREGRRSPSEIEVKGKQDRAGRQKSRRRKDEKSRSLGNESDKKGKGSSPANGVRINLKTKIGGGGDGDPRTGKGGRESSKETRHKSKEGQRQSKRNEKLETHGKETGGQKFLEGQKGQQLVPHEAQKQSEGENIKENGGRISLDVGPELNAKSLPLTGGAANELRRRLPNKYQYFLEKMSQLWPEFDLSLLFLPYACFSDGQLYYRFLTTKPIFVETHSNI